MQRLQPEEIENQVFPLVRRGYEAEKVDAFLRVVAAYYREALRVVDEESQMSSSPPRAFEAIGGQIASILGSASAAAEDLKEEAEREAHVTRRMAAEEAAQIAQTATNQLALAQQLKAEAQVETEALRAEAIEEANRLRYDARERIARFEQDARERIATLEETAIANVDAFLEEARRRYDELRDAERQSIAHLGTVQNTLRKAKEALTADYPTALIGDLLGPSLSHPHDSVSTTSRELVRPGDSPPFSRLLWRDGDGAKPPPRRTGKAGVGAVRRDTAPTNGRHPPAASDHEYRV
jgi:DivIVA domain-containing protein